LFLIWMYTAWCVVLVGAELVRSLPFLQKELKAVAASELDWALMILQQLKNTNQVERITREDLCQALTLTDIDEWEAVLVSLLDEGWLDSYMDELFLNVDLAQKTVGELSELIHGHRIEKFAVIKANTTWHSTLKPVLMELRQQKKAALGLPVSEVI